jgi:hypothetical protein
MRSSRRSVRIHRNRVAKTCRSRSSGRRSLPERTAETVVGHPRPRRAPFHRSGDEAGRTVSKVSTRLRSAEADPHIAEMIQDSNGAECPCRSSCFPSRSRAGVRGSLPWCPLPGTRFENPPGERPTSRPCSTDESVAIRLPLPAAVRSCLPWACFPFEVLSFPRLAPGVVHRSKKLPVGRRPAEAVRVPWARSSYRLPGTWPVGPWSCSELQGGPQHPFVGCRHEASRNHFRPFPVPLPPKSVRERELRAVCRPGPDRCRSGPSRRVSRRPPWGFRRQRTLPRKCLLGRARVRN